MYFHIKLVAVFENDKIITIGTEQNGEKTNF